MKNKLSHVGLAILRVGLSASMLTHGYSKMQKLFSEEEIQFADPIFLGAKFTLILAVLSEFIAPILIIIGFKTRIAAIFPFLTMAVAFFVIHGSDPFQKQELAFVYGIGFLAIALLGAGKYSLDGEKRR